VVNKILRDKNKQTYGSKGNSTLINGSTGLDVVDLGDDFGDNPKQTNKQIKSMNTNKT